MIHTAIKLGQRWKEASIKSMYDSSMTQQKYDCNVAFEKPLYVIQFYCRLRYYSNSNGKFGNHGFRMPETDFNLFILTGY